MKKNRMVSILLAILSLLMSIGLFISCTDDSSPVKPATKATLSGTVTDLKTGNSVANALVTLQPTGRSIATGNNGSYSFDELDADTYTIKITSDGYSENTATVTVKIAETNKVDIQLAPIQPELSVDKELLNFGTTSTTQTFIINNSGTGELTWSIAPSENWATVTPASGTTSTGTSPVTVSINRTGLTYGNHSTPLTITSNANSKTVEVFVVVPDPTGLQLSAYPTMLNFATSGTEMELSIQNTGAGMLSWSISDDAAWLSCTPTTGTTEGEIDKINVTVNRYGLTPGNYTGNITVTSDGGSETITVSMEVSNQPLLTVTPASLDFGDASETKSFKIENSSAGDLNWTITDNQDWLTVSNSSGTGDKTITVTVERDDMEVGFYSGNITINSNAGNQIVSVDMEVNENLPNGVILNEPTNPTGSTVDLSWTRYIGGDFASYRLYRYTSPSVNYTNGHLVGEYLATNSQNATDTGLTAETTYYYRIYVFNSDDQYLPSNAVSITTPPQLGQWYLAQSTGVALHSIDMLNENFAFAGGNGGEIWSKTGTNSWSEESVPTCSYSITDIEIINQTNVYAINTDYGAGYLRVYKFNGSIWSEVEEYPGNYAKCITATDANHIWIGDENGKIHFFNGNSWSTTDLDYSSINQIYAIDNDNVLTCDSNEKLIHYNGIGWVELKNFNDDDFNVQEIKALSMSDIWGAGADGKIAHYNGSQWTYYDVKEHFYSASYDDINDISIVSADDVWFACDNGVILHWDGNSIQPVTNSSTSHILAIHMLSNTDGWAVGEGGKFYRYH